MATGAHMWQTVEAERICDFWLFFSFFFFLFSARLPKAMLAYCLRTFFFSVNDTCVCWNLFLTNYKPGLCHLNSNVFAVFHVISHYRVKHQFARCWQNTREKNKEQMYPNILKAVCSFIYFVFERKEMAHSVIVSFLKPKISQIKRDTSKIIVYVSDIDGTAELTHADLLSFLASAHRRHIALE